MWLADFENICLRSKVGPGTAKAGLTPLPMTARPGSRRISRPTRSVSDRANSLIADFLKSGRTLAMELCALNHNSILAKDSDFISILKQGASCFVLRNPKS
ncbi:MAG: hypothetical protein A4E45_02305 [Methanosaeta sp. PtaB.Bin039]|nr:MAG: hypothetical protein A4E45_02305 [Methanosaeta sp. PtaB.Bin039]